MKNKFYIIFFTLILAGFTAFGQVTQIITHVDTLQSGDVIVTISDSPGNIIDKGLAKPGFVLQNDTTDMVYPTGSSDENPDDVFVDNIDLPGDTGGFLPQDVVYNPHNNKYYIYGYRKIMICDANMQPVKTIDISDVDRFSTFSSDYHERRIFVHPTQNKVYGMTINGAMFSIDQYYNKVELTDPIGDYLIERSSMIYSESDNTIWYYFYVKDENMNDKTFLYKFAISNSQLSPPVPIQGIIGYDIESISFEASYLILLSTNDGIMRYNPDMTSLLTIEPQNNFGHIAVMNNLIFAHMNSTSSMIIRNATGGGELTLSLNYPDVRFMLPDPTCNKMYLSGYSGSSSGIDIIWYNVTQWETQNCTYQNIFGLSENSTQIIGCGMDKIVFFDKQTGNQAYFTSTSLGQMYRVSPGSSANIAVATQPLNGNVLKISSTGTQILETGGNISGICRKRDKLYAAVNKFNNKGYIIVLNASSGAVVDKFEPTISYPNLKFNPIDVFCLDDESVDNDRIYIIYAIPDNLNMQAKNKILCFNSENPVQIDFSNQEFANGLLEYVISPNGTVFIGEKNEDCASGCPVYFFHSDLTPKTPEIVIYPGCIKEFSYVKDYDYFVWMNYCDDKIYFFKDFIDHVSNNPAICFVDNPISFSYNTREGVGYFSTSNGNPYKLHIIDLSQLNTIAFENNASDIKTMFYNTKDYYTYGISSDKIYKIGNEDVIFEHSLPNTITIDLSNNHNREDDFALNTYGSNNILYVPIIDHTDLLDSKKVMVIDLSLWTYGYYTSSFSYQNAISVLFPSKPFNLFGKFLAYYPEKQNLYCAQQYFSAATIATEHVHTRTLTGNWDWISFPCMPRLGDNGYESQTLLENINPLQPYLKLITSDEGYDFELTYSFGIWNTTYIPFLYSTQGYKYYSQPVTTQNLPVTGVVLDPATSIPLSSQYENWIGYFLEYSLSPEDAFVGIWDKLTRVSTKDWTIYLRNGIIIAGTGHETPISYGDGLIVEVSEDCELIWNNAAEGIEDFEYPQTEYFTYEKQAEYIPFYFEMDSIAGVTEIGLSVNDSCVGAAVAEPGDSIVEVNAYLAGFPSGVPIEVETWSGYKSARIGTGKYSVVDPSTRKRVSRKVYTGEQKAFYIISFKAGETEQENPVALLHPASPNPFSSATMLSFVLNQQANVALTVHDLRGNLIKTLMQGVYNEGFYEAGWTGTDASGQQAGNGVYIIRLTVDDRIIKHEKVVLIK